MALPHEGIIKVSGVRKKIQIFLSGLPCKPYGLYCQPDVVNNNLIILPGRSNLDEQN